MKFLSILTGYRTYIAAAAIAAVAFALRMGWLTKEDGEQLLAALGAAGLAFLRMAVGKTDDAEPKQ